MLLSLKYSFFQLPHTCRLMSDEYKSIGLKKQYPILS